MVEGGGTEDGYELEESSLHQRDLIKPMMDHDDIEDPSASEFEELGASYGVFPPASPKKIKKKEPSSLTDSGEISFPDIPFNNDEFDDNHELNMKKQLKETAKVAKGVGVFDSVLFVGRQDELSTLEQAVERISLEWMENPAEVMWVEGEAGSGKTALANHASEATFWKAYVCRGTCEQYSSACKPFKAISDCLDDLVSKMEAQGGSDVWKPRLEESLGGEGPLLASIVPKLCKIMKIKAQRRTIEFDSNQRHQFDRLGYAIRDLLRTVAEARPLIMIIDNLHCADLDSLQVIFDLLTTKSVNNFLLVGCHEELTDEHPLTILKHTIPNDVHSTTIQLGNFDVKTTVDFINGALVGDAIEIGFGDDIEDFAYLLHKRTEGNPFEVLEWLKILYEKKKLTYSADHLMWSWNYDAIKKVMKKSEADIIDLMAVQMEEYPKKLRIVLTTAAALRLSHFRVDTLYSCIVGAFHNTYCPIEDIKELKKLIGSALRKGLFKQMQKPGYFRFSHDLLRDAAATLLPKKEKGRRINLNMGNELARMAQSATLKAEERDRLKFLAIDQLNRGSKYVEDTKQLKSFATLNLEAAETSITKSAFRTALQFIQNGIDLMEPEIRWEKENFNLTYRLLLTEARVKYSIGELEEAKTIADNMLSNIPTLRDQIPVFNLKVLILMAEDKPWEALEMILNILEHLGEKPPSKDMISAFVMKEVDEIRKLARTKNNAALLNLPRMTDKKALDVMEILCALYQIGILCGYSSYQDFSIMRMTRITLVKGFCKQTPLVYSLFGVALINFGLHKEAFRFGRLSERFFTRPDVKEENVSWKNSEFDFSHKGLALSNFHRHISHWRRSYKRNLEAVLKVYNYQIDSGDFDQIAFTISSYVHHHIASGFDLRALEENMELFEGIFVDYNIRSRWQLVIPKHVLQCLNGEREEPLLIFGESEEEQEHLLKEWQDKHQEEILQQFHFFRMLLAVFFNDLEIAKQSSLRLVRSIEGVWIPYQIFCECMIVLGLVRTSKGKIKARYQDQAVDMKNRLTEWYNAGDGNIDPMITLLEAEYLVSTEASPSLLRVRSAFEEAIDSAKDADFVHFEALANERAAIHFISAGTGGHAPEFLTRARDLYDKWGAFNKAIDLEFLYPEHLDVEALPQKRIAANYREKNKPPQLKPISPKTAPKSGVARVSQVAAKKVKSTGRRVKMLFAKSEHASKAPWGWSSNAKLNVEDLSESSDSEPKSPKHTLAKGKQQRASTSGSPESSPNPGRKSMMSPVKSPKGRWSIAGIYSPKGGKKETAKLPTLNIDDDESPDTPSSRKSRFSIPKFKKGDTNEEGKKG